MREDTVEKHKDQNAKLHELRDFLQYVLNEHADDYIDRLDW